MVAKIHMIQEFIHQTMRYLCDVKEYIGDLEECSPVLLCFSGSCKEIVIIPESCFEIFQEIHHWIITKQTVDVPRCVKTSKLNIILWLMCEYLSGDTLVLNNNKKVWWN